MAALRGGCLLAGDVLLGKPGAKAAYSRGLSKPVALCCSEAFKQEEVGMTMVLRHACQNGWSAVPVDGLKSRGRKPSIFLRGCNESERIPGLQGARAVLSFTANGFVDWVTSKCLIPDKTGRIRGQPGCNAPGVR